MGRLFMVIALATLAAGTAQARIGGGDPIEMFEQADRNHDGRISRAEFVDSRSARFRKMDRNDDGAVSRDDFGRLARFRPEAVERLEQMIEGADANHDGRMTLAELKAAPTPIFDHIDNNHDDVVDAAELAAAKASLTKRR